MWRVKTYAVFKRERGKNIRVKTKSERKKANPKVSFLCVRKEEIQPSFVISCGFLLPYFLHHFFSPSSERKRVELLFLPLPPFFFPPLLIQSSIFLSFLYYCFLFFSHRHFFISVPFVLSTGLVVAVHLLTEELNIIAELAVMPGPPYIHTFPEEDSYNARAVFVLTEMCADEQRPRAAMTSTCRGWKSVCV